MKITRLIGELITSAVLITILVLILTADRLLMPMSTEAMLTIGLVIVFFLFSTLVWKEQPRDERDHLHRLNAGRVSFLIGTSVLVIGIAVQSLEGAIDPWLIYTLTGMVLAKILSRLYLSSRA